MSRNTKRLFAFTTLFGLALLLLAAIFVFKYSPLRPKPAEKNNHIYQGVTYIRTVRSVPRSMIVHVVVIDLRQPGLSFLVTPGDPKSDLPLAARTTSQFLKEFGAQVAINGDSFLPWRSRSPLDYYPHAGDPVEPHGLAASNGVVYSQNPLNFPVLYISRTNQARFNTPTGKIYNAISGTTMLVSRGSPDLKSLDEVDNPETPQPRSAVGLDKRNQRLYLVIVDGRQPGYSEGATLAELAQILIEYGAYTAMNLDGGGSSTLVKRGLAGTAQVLNSPIDNQIPGRERNVGNHLGVFAPSLDGD